MGYSCGIQGEQFELWMFCLINIQNVTQIGAIFPLLFFIMHGPADFLL